MTEHLPECEGRWGAVAYTPTPFSPLVDGEVLPVVPWPALAAGAADGVDLLVGHTRDEFRLLGVPLGPTDDERVDALLRGLTPTPGEHDDRGRTPNGTADVTVLHPTRREP